MRRLGRSQGGLGARGVHDGASMVTRSAALLEAAPPQVQRPPQAAPLSAHHLSWLPATPQEQQAEDAARRTFLRG